MRSFAIDQNGDSMLEKILEKLASNRLTVVLLLLIAALAIIGTVIEQNQDPVKYIQIYGEPVFRLLNNLGFFDMYHSWWFVLLLTLLGINIAACTLERWPQRIAVVIVHLSLFLIFAGGIVGSLYGFRTQINIPVGQASNFAHEFPSMKKIFLPFTIRADDFQVSFYKGTQRPQEFKSQLTILEGEKEIKSQEIRVNHPLIHRGIRIFQANYGPVDDPLIEMRLKDRRTNKIVKTYTITGHDEIKVGRETYRITGYAQDMQGFGPAVQLMRMEKGGQPQYIPIFKNYPGFGVQKGDRYQIELVNIEEKYFTGLQIVKDPGVNLVWAGCVFLILGTLYAFLTPKENQSV